MPVTAALNLVSFPGGVIDSVTRRAFVTDSVSTVQRVEIENGAVNWRIDMRARPVATFDDSVLTVAKSDTNTNELRLIALDVTNGSLSREVSTISFPDWVNAAITPDDTFDYQLSVVADELVLSWQAQMKYRGGAAPPNHLVAQLPRSEGVERINVRTGVAEAAKDTNEKSVYLPQDVREAIAFSYQQGASAEWHSEPWSFDNHFAAIAGEVSGESQILKLCKWKAGATTADVQPLISGAALVSYVTADGLFVLIHSELSDGPDRSWSIFSVSTGKKIAVLKYEDGAREASVSGTTLYYLIESPPPSLRTGGENVTLTLKAVDTASGSLLWTTPLSDRSTRKAPMLRQ